MTPDFGGLGPEQEFGKTGRDPDTLSRSPPGVTLLVYLIYAPSDRRVASVIGVSKNTAASVREELEIGGQFDHHETRVGKDDIEQPATKTPKSVFASTDQERPLRSPSRHFFR